jgi:hypothetical protein
MTVRELIVALATCDQDRYVVFMDDWWVTEVDSVDPDYRKYTSPTEWMSLVMLTSGNRL